MAECPECGSESYKPHTNPHSKVTRTYCENCGYGLNEAHHGKHIGHEFMERGHTSFNEYWHHSKKRSDVI